MLSNAIETKVGSITAEWEHFFNWLRAEDEKEKIDREDDRSGQGTSLERVIAGLVARAAAARLRRELHPLLQGHSRRSSRRTTSSSASTAPTKRSCKREELAGKLGVFWHTQGSGKSFSMIFYARKIFRKLTGNFTFVVVTDRDDLDGQIYRNFLHTGTVTEAEAAQPKDSEEMRKFLGQNKRLVFTLIQKFRWPKGKAYPLLSHRDDIIVIVDEAHRTQYKDLWPRTCAPACQERAVSGLHRHAAAGSRAQDERVVRRLRLRIQLPAVHGRRRDRAACSTRSACRRC